MFIDEHLYEEVLNDFEVDISQESVNTIKLLFSMIVIVELNNKRKYDSTIPKLSQKEIQSSNNIAKFLQSCKFSMPYTYIEDLYELDFSKDFDTIHRDDRYGGSKLKGYIEELAVEPFYRLSEFIRRSNVHLDENILEDIEVIENYLDGITEEQFRSSLNTKHLEYFITFTVF